MLPWHYSIVAHDAFLKKQDSIYSMHDCYREINAFALLALTPFCYKRNFFLK